MNSQDRCQEVLVREGWLALLCQMIPHVQTGLFVPQFSAEGKPDYVSWPSGVRIDEDLLDSVKLAKKRAASVISAGSSSANPERDSSLIVASPISWGGSPAGIVAVRSETPANQENAVLQLLRWGGEWLRLLESGGSKEKVEPSGIDLALLLSITNSNDLDSAAANAATHLCGKWDCDRVAIGLKDQQKIRVTGLSHSTQFDARSNLIQQIRAVMAEALQDNRTCQVHKLNNGSNAKLPAHKTLSERDGGHCVCSILLFDRGKPSGVVVLERDTSFGLEDIVQLETSATLIGALLERKVLRTREQLGSAYWRFMPTERWKRILGITVSLVLLGFLMLGVTTHQVVGKARLEGAIQRAVVSPFQGYVAESNVRAGETVKTGELLAKLKEDELRLEFRKWVSQRNEYDRQYRKALSSLNHSEAKIFRSQVSQAEAEIELIEMQLAQTELKAPFDGVVIEGDLSQLLGTPVERGEVLFKISPLNHYRVVIEIDERDIPEIVLGDKGMLTLSALPGGALPFVVRHIASVSKSEGEGIFFRVEADLSDSNALASLRPGMEGIGKVNVGSASRLWVWTRRLVNWAQLLAWKWLP